MNVFLVLTLFILAGCASAPTRIDGLNLESSGLGSGVELNGVLIRHDDKFVLDKSFRVPTVPHDKDAKSFFSEGSVSFISIPGGPWEFNGATLFPGFNGSSLFCTGSDGCDPYNQLKGPFIHFDCRKLYTPNSSTTYSQRAHEIEREKEKSEREKTKTDTEDTEITALEVAGVAVVVVGVGTYLVLTAPFHTLYAGLNELGICEEKKIVWFDHDKFFDTVKKAIINDYGSINAYVSDIRQASMAYNILASINKGKREKIETLIHEWNRSVEKLLPENASIDNYQIIYTPYLFKEIPRKADWSKRPTAIEVQILNHYTEQSSSVNRQIDFHDNKLKQKYGVYINISP